MFALPKFSRVLFLLLLLSQAIGSKSIADPISSKGLALPSVGSTTTTFTFGLPAWAEVMIGFAVGTPIQGLKLFFPFNCVRNGFEVVLESADFYLFFNELTYGSSDYTVKHTFFVLQSLVSIIIELPQILNTCLPSSTDSPLAHELSTFSDSIMDLVKTIVYLDTSFNMMFNKQWLFSGYYGMYSVLNIVSFIAFVSLNTQNT